ncbi:MAG TPA: HD domain-containing phosphohydrolase [Bryobacteraceae bacterium]|nr:HD domain-containing phosphohydrolase [Bryobacteraceae bacterium]
MHHENFDGAGYPYALAGEKIPLDARVIRVADAFDAMTTDRAYRPALTAESALKIVENGSGREFDPRCAAAMSKIMRLRGRRELVHPAASDLFATSRPAPAKLIA